MLSVKLNKVKESNKSGLRYRLNEELLAIAGKPVGMPKVEWLGVSSEKSTTFCKQLPILKGENFRNVFHGSNATSNRARRCREMYTRRSSLRQRFVARRRSSGSNRSKRVRAG